MKNTFTIVAKTMGGFEQITAQEITDLGGIDIKILNRAVSFTGDQALLYKANLCLRTAVKVLVPFASFKVKGEDELYKKVYDIAWEEYFNMDQTFAIDAVVSSIIFTHSKYVSLKMKDAIVDRFRDREGERPNVDVANPDLRLNIFVVNDPDDEQSNIVTLSKDSSGESLHLRRYKTASGEAPLNEVLAAGLVLQTGWDKKTPLYDLMCGSGTILTEAAMIAFNIYPQFYRNDFGFTKWNDFNPSLLGRIKSDLEAAVVFTDTIIVGCDMSETTLAIAQKNVNNMDLGPYIQLSLSDMMDFPPLSNSLLILNPPYDVRLKEDDVENLYKNMGNKFKQDCKSCTAWVLSANKDAMKNVGLRTSKRLTFKNGSLETKFYQYKLF